MTLKSNVLNFSSSFLDCKRGYKILYPCAIISTSRTLPVFETIETKEFYDISRRGRERNKKVRISLLFPYHCRGIDCGRRMKKKMESRSQNAELHFWHFSACSIHFREIEIKNACKSSIFFRSPALMACTNAQSVRSFAYLFHRPTLKGERKKSNDWLSKLFDREEENTSTPTFHVRPPAIPPSRLHGRAQRTVQHTVRGKNRRHMLLSRGNTFNFENRKSWFVKKNQETKIILFICIRVFWALHFVYL